ncbi:aminotransferase class III-fold pyridoxal phosphate-dependent enzyme, partial [Listeria monocytogenes]
LAFQKYGEEIAAVIVEPVAGNMGVVPPIDGFLEGLRELTTKFGSLLIFDEVMTGFRVDYYSAQGYYVVTPDLTCLGKVIGGGLPVGAYGGKKEIMEQIAPAGSIYQAGTLSGNPLAMNAGFETVRQLTPQHYDVFRTLIKRMEEGLTEISARRQVPLSINKAGSMFGFFFTDQKVINFDTAKTSNLEFFRNYYREMLGQGIFLPPSQFEGVFISTMHTEKEIDKTLEAFDTTCKILRG